MELADIDEAAAIVRANYTEEWETSAKAELAGMFSNAPIRPTYLVAEDEGRIEGFAGFTQSWMDYGVYEVFWVNVLPDAQGTGIGTALVARVLEDIAAESPEAIVLLTATEKNARYYAKHFGFKELAASEGFPYQLMSLRLAGREVAGKPVQDLRAS